MAPISQRIYRLLLSLYPASFRAAHAQELEQIYAWCMAVHVERGGILPASVRGLADALRGAIALRRRDGSDRPRWGSGPWTQDLRSAVRAWWRAPFLTAGIILILALGIGANGAIFSLVRAVLLEPLPYERPDELAMLWYGEAGRQRAGQATAVVNWRRGHGGALKDVAALQLWHGSKEADFDLVLADRAERLRAGVVTSNLFALLGARPHLGRLFTPADEAAGQTNLVVLSYGVWQRAFGGDPLVVGRPVTFVTGSRERGPRPFTVIGVLPPAFRFTYPVDTEVWTIYPWSAIENDPTGGAISLSLAVTRLAPGVSFEQAAAVMAAVSPYPQPPDTPPDRRRVTRLERMSDWVTGTTRPSLTLLSAVSLLLLLVTCATVATAMLVRLAERQREMAVRASLGAGRSRLLRQLLTEGAALAGAGTLAGVVLASALLPAFRSLVPAVVPRADEMSVNAWMLAFAAAAATVVTVLSAFLPAWQASRTDVVSALKRASGIASAARSSVRWRRGLAAVQSALAAGLLVGAMLLLASFWRLGRVPLGFDGDRVLTVEMRLLEARYYKDPAGLLGLQDEMVARVHAIPGVEGVGVTTAVPFRGVDFSNPLDAPGCERMPWEKATPQCADRTVGANKRTVDNGFFEVMDIPLRQGRLFLPTDTASAPKVIVVSESFARQMFGDTSPIGQRVSPGEIVGVVGDARYVSRDRGARAAWYVSRSQDPSELICLVLRTSPDAGDLGAALMRAVREVDSSIPVMNLTTIDRIVSNSVADRRFYTTTTAGFAGLALLLTMAGLGVVIARTVVERRRELAIRAALGARPAQLIRLVGRQGILPAILGTAAGLTIAWAAASVLEPFLFEIAPRQVAVYVAAGVVTVGIAVVACVVSAGRAAGLEPVRALRSE